MSESKYPFADAVADALHTLESRDYMADDAVVYCHPETFNDALERHDRFMPHGEELTIHGCEVINTSRIPNSMICVAVVSLPQRGIPDGLAFEEVK